jgi:hypothetical protein
MEQVIIQYVNESYKSESDGVAFMLSWCLGFLVAVSAVCVCLWVTR